jgi:hypothetical protein
MSREPAPQPRGEFDGYVAPMADMMAGVVFLFLIMLMTLALFNIEGKQDQQIESQEVKRQKQISHILIDRKLIIEQLARDLAARGLEVTTNPDQGELYLPSRQFFPAGAAMAGDAGRRHLAVIAETLSRHIGCHVAGNPGCPRPASSRVQQVLLHLTAHPADLGTTSLALPTLASARALDSFAAVIGRRPDLFDWRNDLGERLITANGQALVPVRAANSGGDREGQLMLKILMLLPAATDGSETVSPRQ